MSEEFKHFFSGCLFIIFCFLMGTIIHSSRPLLGSFPLRLPSSEQSDCNQILEKLATEAESNAIARFVFQKTHFDEEIYESEKAWFIDRLKSLQDGDKVFVEHLGDRPLQHETIVAFIEAVRVSQGLYIPVKTLTPSLKRKIMRLSQKLMAEQGPIFRDTQDVLSELFEQLYGSVPEKLMMNSAQKKEVLSRAMMEAISFQGLQVVLPHFKSASESSLIAGFRQSRLGKFSTTGFLNLPVLMGLPPLYLPGLRRLQLSPELAQKALDQGLNQVSLNELEKSLNLKSRTLSRRAHYEIFRRYYMVGVSGYLILAMAYDSYQEHEALKQEQELLQELSMGVGELLAPLSEMDQRHPSCASLERCFEANAVNFETFEPQEMFLKCQQLFDRRDQCDQY